MIRGLGAGKSPKDWLSFTNLDTTSKRYYLLILLHERDRMSLERIFQLTRKSKTLELTQVCAKSLYILQYEFQSDEEDPEYFHRKLQEIYAGGLASNDVKMFQKASRLRNMIEHDYLNSEDDVKNFQEESWQMLDTYTKWGATDPHFKEQTEDIIREQFEIMKDNERITSEAGFNCLSRLGISIPRTYYISCFENGNERQKINAINGLSTSIDSVEILEFASNNTDRGLLRKVVHKLSKIRRNTRMMILHTKHLQYPGQGALEF